MKEFQFTIIVQPDAEGNFVALCPALQGCYTEGESPEEALDPIQDAIRLHPEDRIERGEPIFPEVYSSQLTVAA